MCPQAWQFAVRCLKPWQQKRAVCVCVSVCVCVGGGGGGGRIMKCNNCPSGRPLCLGQASITAILKQSAELANLLNDEEGQLLPSKGAKCGMMRLPTTDIDELMKSKGLLHP